MRSETSSVLVVGGGLAGLAAALFLAARGVRVVPVEKHPGSSPHPRAIGFTPRTLELLRAVGLEQSVPQSPAGHGRPRRVAVESLAGTWAEETAWSPPAKQALRDVELTPCKGAAIAQDKLEPILRYRAIALGADVRMSTKLVSFEQDESGVTAVLEPRGGEAYTLRADYMVAADGHASPVREALGITRSGHGVMRVVRSVMFRADLDQYLAKGISQFMIDQPGLRGMLTTYRDGRWLLMFEDDHERDEATLKALVVRAIGRTDVPFELITTGRWVLSALIADRFSSGRIFLAGDAAHTLPPARGGYGANTGIEDASNLAWKLAAVIAGTSSPALLDSYDAERRPIAWLRHDQIFARPDYADVATPSEKAVPILDDDAMELGQLYRSSVIEGATADLPPARRPDEWAGQPGTRAPHLWITTGEDPTRVSTLDVFQKSWVLVTADAARWSSAAKAATTELGIEVRCPTLHAEPGALATAFGIDEHGASLVRPDGHVAWRSENAPPDPRSVLIAALTKAACAKA